MKKSTLLLSILGISTISSAIVPITSCSTTQNHVWLNSVDQPTKIADDNYKAKYYFGLDANYETKDIKVTIESDSKDVLILNYFVSNNVLVAEIEYTAWVEETTKIKFNLNFSTSQWSQQIKDLVLNIQINDPIDLFYLKKINKILAKNECNTMNDAITVIKANGIDVENLTCKTENGIYVWDQSENRFAIINSVTGELIYGTDGYVLNPCKWQLWKMVTPSEFDSYNQYSQYLKSGLTSNDSTDGNYSFISGFDAGSNTNVKNVHYFYEKMEGTQTKKDIIINTNSLNTTVDVSAWSDGENGDIVTHYGKTSDLTIVTNCKYVECGKVISASVCDGIVIIANDANIKMTYVRSEDVTLNQYKTGTDIVYAETNDIAAALESSGISVPGENIVDSSKYQEIKEKAIEDQGVEVSHVFTVTGGTSNEYYETLSDIAAATNASNDPELFAGKTITLNKDYDMAAESLNWTPICNGNNNFKGIIDGNGHSILNFNVATNGSVALIASNQGSVKNLNFVDCALSTTNGRASLISLFNFGNNEFINLNFYNCSTKSTASSGFAIGYLLSDTGSTALIQNCYTDEDCYAIGEGSSVVQTGFISQCCTNNYDAGEWVKFKDCEMHLNVKSHYAAGSYVGQLGAVNDDAYKSFSFENCSAYGNIIIEGTAGNGPMGGGFIGAKQHNAQTGHVQFANTTTFKNCQNYCNVYALDRYLNVDNLGGFIGYSNNGYLSGASISFENCTNSGQIGKINPDTSYTPNGCGGFVGRTMSDGNVSWTFTQCTNEGYIESSVAGHFIGILGSSTSPESKQCINCSIEGGSLLSGSSRTKITGEPA